MPFENNEQLTFHNIILEASLKNFQYTQYVWKWT
jgi:hypothetical protein